MRSLHARILAYIDHWADITGQPEPVASALRLVVEQHAPENAGVWHHYLACKDCTTKERGAVDWPCSTIRTIAAALEPLPDGSTPNG